MSPSHLLYLIVFSALVSAVFATLLRDDRRSRLRFGLAAFAAFVVSIEAFIARSIGQPYAFWIM